MKKIWIIFAKEVLDSIRDKRSWATGLFWALFGPVLMGGMMIFMGTSLRDQVEKPMTLPVQHPENAPGLVQFLKQHDMIVVPAPADPQAAVKNGDIKVVLVIPEDYASDFASSRTATLQLVMDSSRAMQQMDVLRIRTLLEQYSSYMGKLRLITRGISPEVIQAIHVEQVDVATSMGMAMLLVSYLPYFMIFAIFNGAAPIVIDTTAGERERQSLEPLLINPVRRRTFVLGKLFAAFPFSIADLLITLIGFAILFNIMPIKETLGTRIELNGTSLVAIFLVSLPIVFLAGSMEMLVASFVRSTRGQYLSALSCTGALPGRIGHGVLSRKGILMDHADPHLRPADLDLPVSPPGTGQTPQCRDCHCRNDPDLHWVYPAGCLALQSRADCDPQRLMRAKVQLAHLTLQAVAQEGRTSFIYPDSKQMEDKEGVCNVPEGVAS